MKAFTLSMGVNRLTIHETVDPEFPDSALTIEMRTPAGGIHAWHLSVYQQGELYRFMRDIRP